MSSPSNPKLLNKIHVIRDNTPAILAVSLRVVGASYHWVAIGMILDEKRTMTSPDPDQPQHPLANLDDRFSAFVIDAVTFFVTVISLTMTTVPIIDNLLSDDNYFYFVLAIATISIILLVLVIWGGLLEGMWGLTPGKAILGLKTMPVKRLKVTPVKLKVVSADDHNQTIGFARGIAREIIRSTPLLTYFLLLFLNADLRIFGTLLLLSVLVFVLDHLWPLWDKKRQALHDKIANSHVVNTHKG